MREGIIGDDQTAEILSLTHVLYVSLTTSRDLFVSQPDKPGNLATHHEFLSKIDPIHLKIEFVQKKTLTGENAGRNI